MTAILIGNARGEEVQPQPRLFVKQIRQCDLPESLASIFEWGQLISIVHMGDLGGYSARYVVSYLAVKQIEFTEKT